MSDFLNELLFLFQRLSLESLIDIFLVTVIFFVVLKFVQGTQATALLRGMIFLVIVLSLLTSLVNLPAFSWLVRTILPALFLAIPVIFQPELRRGLERLGRAGSGQFFPNRLPPQAEAMQAVIKSVVTACARLSARQHGALIILQRNDILVEYMRTGVKMDSAVTPELLLQVFYPNTPLHDGAVIIANGRLSAAACVMPLSASGILNRSPERQMGLRHRAALGSSEATDAIAVVVSEETGSISIAHGGRMIRRLDSERLENILTAFYHNPEAIKSVFPIVQRIRDRLGIRRQGDE